METIAIANTQRQTTRLGFGSSGIVGGIDRRRSLALLETAFDAGIRHFDVAPMYGFGTAETVLGEFLKGHAGEVTVTSKFGVLPEPRSRLVSMVYSVGKRLLRRKQSAVAPHTPMPPSAARPLRKAAFTAGQAAASLQESLRRLHLDSLDLFLLHEAAADDLSDEALLSFLQEQVAHGTIRAFGVGSSFPLLPDLLARKSVYCTAIQSEWSAADAALHSSNAFRITHRSLQGGWQSTYKQMCDSRQDRAWSEYVGVNLADVTIWPKLLLRAALAVNPGSMVLFSTTNPSRIHQNVTTAQDTALASYAIRFQKLLHGKQQAQNGGSLMVDDLLLSPTSENAPSIEHSVAFN